MAERIVIQIDTDDQELDKTIDKLEHLGVVDKKNAAQFRQSSKQQQSDIKKTGKEVDKFGQLATRAASAVAAMFAVDQIISFGKEVTNITAEFQKLQAVLKTALGSNSAAEDAFSMIQEFASQTPFSVRQLTGSFVKLVNQGFKPTRTEMRKLGDLASSTGKDFDQLAEAIIDAQVGEMERLKEFGVRAQQSGDRVKFTFKGVTTVVERTDVAIRDYILSLGDLQGVSGSMAAISETLGGKISNLGDKWDAFLYSVGKGDSLIGGIINKFIDLSAETIDLITNTEKQSETLSKQNAQFNIEINTLKNANLNQAQRNELIGRINKKYSNYLPNLISESDTIDDIATKQAEANKQFEKRIVLLAAEEKLIETTRKRLDLQTELVDLELKRTQIESDLVTKEFDRVNTLRGVNNEEQALKTALQNTNAAIRQNREEFDLTEKEYQQVTKAASDLGISLASVDGSLDNITKKLKGKEVMSPIIPKEAEYVTAGKTEDKWLKEQLKKRKKANEELLKDGTRSSEEWMKEQLRIENNWNDLKYYAAQTVASTGIKIFANQAKAETDILLNELNYRKDANIITDEQYQAERKRILTEQAKQEKALALFEVAIATAVEVTKSLSEPPLAIAAGIAGAAQAAVIASQPIPQFRKGGWIDGKSHGQGGVMIEAEGSEFMVRREYARKYRNELELMNQGLFGQIHDIKAPDIDILRSLRETMKESAFNDQNIVNELKRSRRIEKEQAKLLHNIATCKHRNLRNQW